MNALGILLGLWIGCWIHWRKLAILISIFPILLLLGSLSLPESPLWLLLHQQSEEAYKSLERLRGTGRKMRVQEELDELRDSIEGTNVSLRNLNWKDIILRKENYLGFSLMIFQQFSGVSAVIYFLAMVNDVRRTFLLCKISLLNYMIWLDSHGGNNKWGASASKSATRIGRAHRGNGAFCRILYFLTVGGQIGAETSPQDIRTPDGPFPRHFGPFPVFPFRTQWIIGSFTVLAATHCVVHFHSVFLNWWVSSFDGLKH